MTYNRITPLKTEQIELDQLRDELGISKETLCLGTVARLDPIKNHPMMLHAFKQVIDQGINTKLLIVGDGEMREMIESLIDKLGLQQYVILAGYQTQPKNYLALMDIYLLSSLSEGTSMTLLEAMSIGKPCVVTDAGGNPEIIEHEGNGLVTINGDADQFAKGILALSSNRNLRTTMAEHSQIRFKLAFSAESMVKQFGELYKETTGPS